MARIRAQTVYMLACGQCAGGNDVIVFGSLARRIDWMQEHARATGHDGYLVQDIERLVAEDHCPICDRPFDVDPEGSVWRCAEHGGWAQRDGNLVPVEPEGS